MKKFEESDAHQDDSSSEKLDIDSTRPRVIPSEELFHGDKTAIIEHAGEQYRLILTKNDKLLLQK